VSGGPGLAASPGPRWDGRPRQEGRVALVTGAAGEIGGAVARRLAAEGATVAVSDRLPGPAIDRLAAEIAGASVPADVTVRSQVVAMVAEIEAAIGPVTTLVCNQAILSMGPFAETDPAEWWDVIDVNLTGSYHLIQAVLPSMRRAGGGRIVLVSSYWGLCGWPDASAYAASKAGLVALAKTLGRELAPEGIGVNAIAPGVIDTPQLEVDARHAGIDRAGMRDRYARAIPAGRVGHPDEVAAAVAFLADRRLGAMIGQVLSINGGELRGRA
jgi:NAD(P)-dependent dehydrogenase (short-subunit alcohol dehydrogenase family)